jgi:excisionase family DNA binding protein
MVNIKGLKDNFEEIWNVLVDEVLSGFISIIIQILIIISRIIYCVLPIKQIRCCFISEYIVVKETDGLRDDIKSGYYSKKDVEEINKAIAENKDETLTNRNEETLDINGAAAFLKLSKWTIYQWTRRKEIPCHKPNGGKLVFFRSELEKFIRGETTV